MMLAVDPIQRGSDSIIRSTNKLSCVAPLFVHRITFLFNFHFAASIIILIISTTSIIILMPIVR